MKDFFGQPLAIGDEVAFMTPGYRYMVMGTIVSFTPKCMWIKWVKDCSNRLDGGPKRVHEKFRALPKQVIKKP